jgi:hypothetical protein
MIKEIISKIRAAEIWVSNQIPKRCTMWTGKPPGYDKLSKPETRVQKLARCAL